MRSIHPDANCSFPDKCLKGEGLLRLILCGIPVLTRSTVLVATFFGGKAVSTTQPTKFVVRFGVFELDVRALELRKAGLRIKVQKQPLQLLQILVERAGAVVSREELRPQLWSADTYVDFDRSLNKAVVKLREALGDSADSPRFIETLPRIGYRFIAPVREQPSYPAVELASTAEIKRQSRFWKIMWLSLALMIFAAAVLLLSSTAAPRLLSSREISKSLEPKVSVRCRQRSNRACA